MNGISTHILDTSRGRPAAGILVILRQLMAGGEFADVSRGVTEADGRIGSLFTKPLAPGDYQVHFDTASYFRRMGDPVFYPEVVIHVRLDAAGGKYHLPLLLNPFGYSTYRGS